MRLRIKDTTYDLDEGRITVAEAKALKRNAGMGTSEFRPGLINGDADSMIFLMWMAKTRAGEKADWSSFDDYDLVSDVEILLDDDADDKEDDQGDGDSGQSGADPTGESGTTRTRGFTTTSRRSRSTSTTTRAKSKS